MELISRGRHDAVCYQVIELGTQYNKVFDNWSNKLWVGFELPAITYVDKGVELPRVISREYFNFIGRKKDGSKSQLWTDLEAWRGAEMSDADAEKFNPSVLLEKPVKIIVDHNTTKKGVYANIVGFEKTTMRGTTSRKPLYYKIGDDIPKGIPQFLKRKIEAAKEMSGADQVENKSSSGGGEVPF